MPNCITISVSFMPIISVYANPTIDTIIKNGKKYQKIGGPPSYIGSVLKNSGFEYSIVSKVGKDFPLSEVSYKPIVTQKPSTKFILEYNGNGSRELYNPEACEPIKPEDVETSDIALVSGVFCEVLPKTLEEIRNKSKIIVADIQGFIRKKDKENKIYQVKLEDTDYKDIVKNIDYLKVSEDEIGFVDLDKLKGITVIVTKGKKGCELIIGNKRMDVPTKPIKEIDPTGAGDCFLAGIGIGLAKGFSIEESCKIGNYFGGLAVKFVGVPEITREDFKAIERRK